jgi:ABC-type Na+ efflux pump permease subunit
MSVLLRKEIRLLLPSFIIALPLAFSVWLVPNDLDHSSGLRMSVVVFPFLLCPAMGIMLALDSFGREISSGTFSSLLAQPTPRAHIWWTKTTLLALALAILLSVWLLSWFLHPPRGSTTTDLRNTTAIVGLFALAAYSGGLWTVLLFRQVAAAFWFTVLTPAALLVTVGELLEDHPERIKATLIVTLSLYSVAGFLWAWRMFFRAQDVAWTGGAVTLPSFRFAPRQLARTEKRRRRPRLALFSREFQLHQSQFVIAGVLAILHLALIAARHFGHGFKSNPTLEFVANQFWFLWMVTPLLVGCASVAEERKLGTLEAQLCLPVRRRSQFAVKWLVVLALSVLFGAGMPVLLEGSRILPELHVDYSAVLSNSPLLPGGIILQTIVSVLAALQSLPFNLLGFLFLATICVVVAAFSFYASSFARNTLQALAPATLTLLLSWLLLVGAYQIEDLLNYPFWRGPLIYLIGIPVMTLTLIGLTYWNYQRVQAGWNVWRRNLLTLLAALVFSMGATTAVYHRVWEYLTPLEPPHGAARLAPSRAPTLLGDGWNLALLLPDGKLWTGRFSLAPSWSDLLNSQPRVHGMINDSFLEGTNWVSVAFCKLDEVAIQSDGSLWVSKQSITTWSPWHPPPVHLTQFGDDRDWKMAASCFDTEFLLDTVFLLKTNGTLWRLESNHPDKRWRGLRTFEPQRLGTDSDWAEILSSVGSIYLRKNDGRVWVFPSVSNSDGSLTLDAETLVERAKSLDQHKWVSVTLGSLPPSSLLVTVLEDGTLRATGMVMRDYRSQLVFGENSLRLGTESNWRAVAGGGTMVVALKTDGSLWKWTFADDPLTKPETASASRLGTHSDWIAITAAGNGVIALARDGSLWQFQSDPPQGPRSFSLLAASRRPQKLGNIFGNAP